MLEAFIEFLDHLYYEGYAAKFEEQNPNIFSRQLAEFAKNYSILKKMKREVIYLLVRVEVESEHKNTGDTIQEIENEGRFILPNTKNVRIWDAEILLTRVRNPKHIPYGTQH
ncbi:hypothetical protein [Pedobacter rhodius]|uniref:Uncharacterized protein n=1 Tax=Pedobacter rhodius TaxID=3004098 RepID=A0ABT4KX43_9SPHI|nr:hypothetical protein [Pedobacter sp. SJ11]MCZ4223509.1 hypothetical protein [Pedobacter sp. SJ11]